MDHHLLGSHLGYQLLLCSPVHLRPHIRLSPLRVRSARLTLRQRNPSLLFSRHLGRPHRHCHNDRPNSIRVAASYETGAKSRRERHLRAWILVSWNP